MFLEQCLRVACLHKLIGYQTLYLSRVGHACRPKLVCKKRRPYEFPRQHRFMRYWINHNATVKKKQTIQPVPKIQPVQERKTSCTIYTYNTSWVCVVPCLLQLACARRTSSWYGHLKEIVDLNLYVQTIRVSSSPQIYAVLDKPQCNSKKQTIQPVLKIQPV